MMPCLAMFVSGNRLVAASLPRLLMETAITVCATVEAAEASATLATVQPLPNVILWDASHALELDLAQITDLHHQFPAIGIAMLTDNPSATDMNLAKAMGVMAFLPRCISVNALSLSLRLISLGENLHAIPATSAPFQNEPVLSAVVRPPLRLPLSPREEQILESISEGHPNKVIARRLGVAEATVKVHVKSILRKIEVTNRTQAAVWMKKSQI